MTAISVTSVTVLDNPSKATNPLQFEIQYECLFPLEDGECGRMGMPRAGHGGRPASQGWPFEPSAVGPPARPLSLAPDTAWRRLSADLEWKITYVGSAESEKYDQVLDTVFVGPVSPGQYRFVFQVSG